MPDLKEAETHDEENKDTAAITTTTGDDAQEPEGRKMQS